jgi:3-hydroxyacyl-CoA dehydrogenase
MEKMIGPDEIEVLIVGSGLMGASLAHAFAQNGINAGLVGRREESLRRANAFISYELGEAIEKGIFTIPQTEEIKNRIFSGLKLEDACRGRNLRLVIEAASENLALKKELFNWLDEFCPPGILLASNTSCLDAEILAGEMRSPERFIWLHFFFPAHKNRMAEYAATQRTLEAGVETAAAYLRKARKIAVRLLRYRKGGAANVIFVALLLEAVRMLEDGFGGAAIEEASKAAFGAPVGFVQLLQAVGFGLAASCLESFSDSSQPDHPFHRVYRNFFSPPERLRQKFAEAQHAGRYYSLEKFFTPGGPVKHDGHSVVEGLRQRFWAVAFMTAAEVVEAGVIKLDDVDRLCLDAFKWREGPFALMNRAGIGVALKLVTERMEVSHRQEVNFPVPRILLEQARRNEPWPI